MMKKKAQLQIMENIFVLLIIFAILAMAFVFVMIMQKSAQKDKIEEFKELEMIKKAQIMNFLPEMQCSDNNNLDPDCYDILKIEVFKKYLDKDKLYYRPLLGNIKIEIYMYDPSPEINKEIKKWELFDNPPRQYRGILPVRFPVLLKDSVENSDYFGYIVLSVYE